MIVLASGMNIYANLEVRSTSSVESTHLKTPKLSQSLTSNEPESSHFKGGVAAAAYEQFKTMKAEDFMLKEEDVKPKETSNRGRKVTKGPKP